MKKVFALLIMLAMVMACGSAMAEIVITGNDLPAGKGNSKTGWSWNGNTLILDLTEIGQEKVTVKGWKTDGRIQFNLGEGDYTANLVLENVEIERNGNVISVYGFTQNTGNVKLNLTLKNTFLISKSESVIAFQNMGEKNSPEKSLEVNIKGENAKLQGNTCIYIQNKRDNSLSSSILTLSGTMEIVGSNRVSTLYVEGGSGSQLMYIDGAATPGIHAEWADNMDGSSPTQVEGSPFSGKSGNLYSKIGGKNFLRLYKPEAPAAPADVPQTGSLPQTGDSSSLALWLCLLAFAGAGMTAMRKREA